MVQTELINQYRLTQDAPPEAVVRKIMSLSLDALGQFQADEDATEQLDSIQRIAEEWRTPTHGHTSGQIKSAQG